MNYNHSSGSQSTPKAYSERLNPNLMKNIERNDRRGDFISLISRSLEDQDMVDRFEMHWKNNIPKSKGNNDTKTASENKKYKMMNMELLDGYVGGDFEGGRFPKKEVMMNNTDFLRSDHAAFWFSNHRDFYASFKAVHISDTGNYGLPNLNTT